MRLASGRPVYRPEERCLDAEIRRPLVNAKHIGSGHQTSTNLQSILIFLLLRGRTPPSCLAPTRSASRSGEDTRGCIGRTGRPFPLLPGSLTGRLVENSAFTHALLPRGSAHRATEATEDTFETGSSAGRGVSNARTSLSVRISWAEA
jgi:hypothetical protein